MLKKHHYVRPALFVYPEESLVNGEWHRPREVREWHRRRLAEQRFLSRCCLETIPGVLPGCFGSVSCSSKFGEVGLNQVREISVGPVIHGHAL